MDRPSCSAHRVVKATGFKIQGLSPQHEPVIEHFLKRIGRKRNPIAQRDIGDSNDDGLAMVFPGLGLREVFLRFPF